MSEVYILTESYSNGGNKILGVYDDLLNAQIVQKEEVKKEYASGLNNGEKIESWSDNNHIPPFWTISVGDKVLVVQEYAIISESYFKKQMQMGKLKK